ncbi:velvet factor [Mycena leptocephala]|nr:velvet factor [Mycena leptocephala]
MSIRMLSGREPQRLPENLRHELLIRQMPVEARASARKHQERRALDPLPVVELVFFEPAGGDATDSRVSVPLYQLTGYTLFAALVDADSEDEVEHLSDGKTNALCGAFISSLFPVPDPATETSAQHYSSCSLTSVFVRRAAFACASLFRSSDLWMRSSSRDCSTRMSVCSAPFNVVAAANYGGVQNSTPLTRALAATAPMQEYATKRAARVPARGRVAT